MAETASGIGERERGLSNSVRLYRSYSQSREKDYPNRAYVMISHPICQTYISAAPQIRLYDILSGYEKVL